MVIYLILRQFLNTSLSAAVVSLALMKSRGLVIIIWYRVLTYVNWRSVTDVQLMKYSLFYSCSWCVWLTLQDHSCGKGLYRWQQPGTQNPWSFHHCLPQMHDPGDNSSYDWSPVDSIQHFHKLPQTCCRRRRERYEQQHQWLAAACDDGGDW